MASAKLLWLLCMLLFILSVSGTDTDDYGDCTGGKG